MIMILNKDTKDCGTGQILDGKLVAQQVKNRVKNSVDKYKAKPCLAIITDGSDPASKIYIKQKKLACEFCHIDTRIYEVADDFRVIYELIQSLNVDKTVHGIILQLPLRLDATKTGILINSINPDKDVDNLGGHNVFQSCTPLGIMRLLDYYRIPIAERNVVIINRSNLVGRPLAKMFLDEDATVTVCHSKTDKEALENYIQDADIIVSAVGNDKFQVGPNLINNGQTLIDVAMNRDENGKLYGDFQPQCYKKCAYYTPVPGGVGPMTVAALMNNTFNAFVFNEDI